MCKAPHCDPTSKYFQMHPEGAVRVPPSRSVMMLDEQQQTLERGAVMGQIVSTQDEPVG